MKTKFGKTLEKLIANFDKVDNLDVLEKVKGELLQDDKQLILEDINELIQRTEQQSVKAYICPDCGSSLWLGQDKVYAHYGACRYTQGTERTYDIVCCSCGYKVE